MDYSEDLKLSNQLCFPLYALSKEIINQYRPFLEALDLTYPQYLVMLVLWESDGLTVGQIGEKIYLDSGTLTPLLKRLEAKEIILRNRCKDDERIVKIVLTQKGHALKLKACSIPSKINKKINLTEEEFKLLKHIINKINH